MTPFRYAVDMPHFAPVLGTLVDACIVWKINLHMYNIYSTARSLHFGGFNRRK